jgi:hypothetical protein
MLIFETDMLVDKPEASRDPVIKMQSGHDRSPCLSAVLGNNRTFDTRCKSAGAQRQDAQGRSSWRS